MIERTDILRVARRYIGTPFHHRARLPGVGMDCAGVPICVARELKLVAEDFDVPDYGLNPDGITIRAWCSEHMREIEELAAQPGDVILLAHDLYPQHMGILGDYREGLFSLIHASSSRSHPSVVETRLVYGRRQRFIAAFVLPGIA